MTQHMEQVGIAAGTVSCDPSTIFDLLRQYKGAIHPAGVIDRYAVINGEAKDVPAFRTALYAICDESSRVLYVGQCRRTTSGVDERLDGHAALAVGGIESAADVVFVVPLSDHLDAATVTAMESTLIASFYPPYNVQCVVPRAS